MRQNEATQDAARHREKCETKKKQLPSLCTAKLTFLGKTVFLFQVLAYQRIFMCFSLNQVFKVDAILYTSHAKAHDNSNAFDDPSQRNQLDFLGGVNQHSKIQQPHLLRVLLGVSLSPDSAVGVQGAGLFALES